jgi:hypothetical protein
MDHLPVSRDHTIMTESLNTAERINGQLSTILAGEYSDDRRVTITLAYLNVSMDHFSAILLLYRSKLYGSGLALVRSIFEAMLRAYWVVGVATSQEVDQVAEDHDFDVMSRVDADRIDAAYRTDGFFRQAKSDAWKAMNAYTHSGLRQLARQFSPAGTVEATYSNEELLEGLSAATASILLLGHLLAHLTGRDTRPVEALFEAAQ